MKWMDSNEVGWEGAHSGGSERLVSVDSSLADVFVLYGLCLHMNLGPHRKITVHNQNAHSSCLCYINYLLLNELCFINF